MTRSVRCLNLYVCYGDPMRKILLSIVSLLSLLSLNLFAEKDLALDVAVVMEFQAAVARCDEEKAMSFIAPDAELILNQGAPGEKRFVGTDEVRRAYQTPWFHVPSKMLILEGANFLYTDGGEIEYSFKCSFSIDKGDGWVESKRQSVSYFTVSNGKIVLIKRFQ
jgi:hypothetical protein